VKSFQNYCRLRENNLESTSDEGESINTSSSPEGKTLFKLIHLAWKNHKDTTKSFFRKLAQVNPEIASELGVLDNEQPKSSFDSFAAKKDKDVVRPSLADTGSGDMES